MPFTIRLLENGCSRLLEGESCSRRVIEGVENNSQQVSCVYPKTWYTWTDRTGISKPDVTGSCSLAVSPRFRPPMPAPWLSLPISPRRARYRLGRGTLG